MEAIRRYGEGIAAGVSGLFIVAAWLLADSVYSGYSVPFFLLAYIIGGFAKAKEGFLTLLREREPDVNLLMFLAAAGAAWIGYWLEGAILIFIFAVSGVMESYTTARSTREIASLMNLKPETARVIRKDGEEEVRVEELQAGDIVLVKPGERIPADGIIRDGRTSVNQAAITGESLPVERGENEEVFAGTLNGEGSVLIEVSCPSESSLFSRIIQLVREAQSELPKSQKFMEKFERIYVKSVLLLTMLLIVLAPYTLGWNWEQTLYRAMVFLVVASPCALMASIMPAMLSAISYAAGKGILFKGGVHLENLADLQAIAFDKTGTLTYGRPVVTDCLPLQGLTERDLLYIAGSMESLSEHPISRAIEEKAYELQLELDRPQSFRAYPGFGIAADLQGDSWKIGNLAFLAGWVVVDEVQSVMERLSREGKTVVLIGNSRGLAGIIAVQDALRPEARESVQRLRDLGLQVIILTGDRRQTAQAVAAKVGIDEVYAELLPGHKLEKIRELKRKYGKVAMLGDGVNDAPALANATVGIAMGTNGSDVALETADLVLMKDDLSKIHTAIQLGKRTRQVIRQNIAFSLLVILLLIVFNFSQSLTLPLGVIGHEGSTILVILNGLRLLKG